jgi:hypothetical protein
MCIIACYYCVLLLCVIIACYYCLLIVLRVVEDYIRLLLSTHLLVHIVRMNQHGLASVICANSHQTILQFP